VKLTYIKQAGEPVGDGGDQYTGLDRFGRVIDQRWPQGASELERVDYGYTPASNRQWRQELVASGQDEYYTYDGLYQVAASNRGTLNGGKTGISGTPTWTEDFTYDPIGNWDAYLTKVSGVTDLDQSRTHNTANQTTEIDGSSATVGHDPAGNMVKVPQINDWASTNELKWDAWNRLVDVKAGATTVAAYGYDGLNRRTTKTIDGTTRRYYYSDQWQIVEERLDAETAAERQFVWGLRYTDDLVLRDRDVDHDASMDERLYVLSDYFNPTAIADEDGVVLERYGYDAFGLSRVMTPDFEPRSSSDYDWETRYGAYRYDPETGFYQVRYRYLHPTLGRWLSRDPIGEQAGLNLYAYTSNSPCNSVDIFGLESGGIYFDRNCNWAYPHGLPKPSNLPTLDPETRLYFWINFVEGGKCVRKVGVIDAKLASRIGLSPTGPNVVISPGQHALNQHQGGPSRYMSASTLQKGATNIGGVPITIDLDKFKAAGGRVIERSEILSDIKRLVAEGKVSPARLAAWLKNQPMVEGEILLEGKVPASAVETPTMSKMKCCAKGLAVFSLAFITRDVSKAAGESVGGNTAAPLTAEAIRQAGGFAGMAGGAKVGGAFGTAIGIESGPGALITGAIGAIIGGGLGYFGADCVADRIHKN
jgi:RHS repeat-associated protein